MENWFPLESCWVVALIAGALAIFMLWQLSRSLPLQNLILVVILLLGLESLIDWFLVKYGWIEWDTLTWKYYAGAGLLWLAVILSCRKLAQVVLEPWRREKYYGLWVLAIAGIFTGAFQFGWPCFNPEPVDQGKAAMMALIRGASTSVILACLTPWLIRKRPFSRAEGSKLAQEPENKTQQNAEQDASH